MLGWNIRPGFWQGFCIINVTFFSPLECVLTFKKLNKDLYSTVPFEYMTLNDLQHCYLVMMTCDIYTLLALYTIKKRISISTSAISECNSGFEHCLSKVQVLFMYSNMVSQQQQVFKSTHPKPTNL